MDLLSGSGGFQSSSDMVPVFWLLPCNWPFLSLPVCPVMQKFLVPVTELAFWVEKDWWCLAVFFCCLDQKVCHPSLCRRLIDSWCIHFEVAKHYACSASIALHLHVCALISNCPCIVCVFVGPLATSSRAKKRLHWLVLCWGIDFNTSPFLEHSCQHWCKNKPSIHSSGILPNSQNTNVVISLA